MADAYLLAASNLVESWEGRHEPWMVCYPVFYICRHALELYLKDALPQRRKPNHNLRPLIDDFRSLLREHLNTDIPLVLRNYLYTLADIDPDGQSFRYATTKEGNANPVESEYYVSLRDLKDFIEIMRRGIGKAVERLDALRSKDDS